MAARSARYRCARVGERLLVRGDTTSGSSGCGSPGPAPSRAVAVTGETTPSSGMSKTTFPLSGPLAVRQGSSLSAAEQRPYGWCFPQASTLPTGRSGTAPTARTSPDRRGGGLVVHQPRLTRTSVPMTPSTRSCSTSALVIPSSPSRMSWLSWPRQGAGLRCQRWGPADDRMGQPTMRSCPTTGWVTVS